MTGKDLIRLIKKQGEEREVMIAFLQSNASGGSYVFADDEILNVCNNGPVIQISVSTAGEQEKIRAEERRRG